MFSLKGQLSLETFFSDRLVTSVRGHSIVASNLYPGIANEKKCKLSKFDGLDSKPKL